MAIPVVTTTVKTYGDVNVSWRSDTNTVTIVINGQQFTIDLHSISLISPQLAAMITALIAAGITP